MRGMDAGPESTSGGAENPSALALVVQAFVRNESGFTPEEVARYANRAICNEAADLWSHRQMLDRDVAAAHSQGPAVPELDLPHQARQSSMWHREAQRYDAGRLGLARVVDQVRGQLPLEPATCTWIARLDHDGMLSRQLGIDATVLGSPTPAQGRALDGAGGAPAGPVAGSGVDYSRELIGPAQAGLDREADRERGSGWQIAGREPLVEQEREWSVSADKAASAEAATASTPAREPGCSQGRDEGPLLN